MIYCLFLFAVAAPTLPPPGICPNFTSPYRGYCYFIEVQQAKSWVDAQADCLTKNMTLASIASEVEIEHIQNMAKDKAGSTNAPKLWIGLSRRGTSSGKCCIWYPYKRVLINFIEMYGRLKVSAVYHRLSYLYLSSSTFHNYVTKPLSVSKEKC